MSKEHAVGTSGTKEEKSSPLGPLFDWCDAPPEQIWAVQSPNMQMTEWAAQEGELNVDKLEISVSKTRGNAGGRIV
jgi:hypothetical protein